ncbi:glucose 1-dehydrogenase [Rhizobium leguminosarum]|uniref:SDR family NAD(P)-dependent oxidoreductase n=1 Tax=Rhizobium leguminosarum TaxID=384 RepID=UPI001C8FBC16|nr:glucose 1-dehydrogenase [Rhizobium leguminosarum]MBY2924310.1 glucose 1-dehydrogenase [Rhizobium leguminosarum]
MKKTMTERLRLDGKVALVTGGAGGMGQAIAQSLTDMGATVVLTDVNGSVADMASSLGDGTDWIVADATNSAEVDNLVAETVSRHGQLDILVANAGISYQSATVDHDDATWRKVMAINVDGTFYAMRAAGRQMMKQGGGAIIGISSICGVTSVRPEIHIGYDASKAAVSRMCKNLAIEWAKAGIRVNAVGPAYTKTKMLQASGDSQPGFMKQWLDDMPVGRLMEPYEIADAVAFLASDAASGITGVELMVDGGYSEG